MNRNIALSDLASCATRPIRAKLLRRVHWLCCSVLHTHKMPGTVFFFNLFPLFHQLLGLYPPLQNTRLTYFLRNFYVEKRVDKFGDNWDKSPVLVDK